MIGARTLRYTHVTRRVISSGRSYSLLLEGLIEVALSW
jgi:hypothetical protein